MAEHHIPADKQACKNCRFLGSEGTPKNGARLFQCRRYPPAVNVVVENRTFSKDRFEGVATWKETLGDVSLWPMTAPDVWCGEWQERV